MKTTFVATIGSSSAVSLLANNASEPAEYIDIHIHANALSDEGFNLKKVREWMKLNNVKKSVVQYGLKYSDFTSKQKQYEHAVRQYKKARGTIFTFGIVHPDEASSGKEAYNKFLKMKNDGIIGFGEHKPGNFAIDDPACVRLYSAASDLGLPVLFHMDRVHNHDEPGLPHLEKLLKAMPECTFIGHANGWWANISGDATVEDMGSYPKRKTTPGGAVERLIQEYPNMYGDLSAGSGANAITRDMDFGRKFLIRNADKLLFGTDTYAMDANLPHFKLFKTLDLPKKVSAKICRENALKILQLS